MTGLGIGWAVSQLKAGSRVRREGWTDDGFVLFEPRPGSHEPHLTYYAAAGRAHSNYLANAEDLFAEDWQIA